MEVRGGELRDEGEVGSKGEGTSLPVYKNGDEVREGWRRRLRRRGGDGLVGEGKAGGGEQFPVRESFSGPRRSGSWSKDNFGGTKDLSRKEKTELSTGELNAWECGWLGAFFP